MYHTLMIDVTGAFEHILSWREKQISIFQFRQSIELLSSELCLVFRFWVFGQSITNRHTVIGR